MEKKNTILLTVIAIATLLVAVVGATFAYFTASITTTNDDNATTTITTQTLVSAVMDMGSSVTASNVLPGHEEIKTVTVTGDGSATSKSVDAVITVTQNIPSVLASDVTWTLYEFTGIKTFDACTNTVATDTTGNKYYETASCADLSSGKAVLSSSDVTNNVATYDLVVAYNTKSTYVLKVDYANTQEVQNADGSDQSGQTYSVTLAFSAK
jgi:hypothetical protein